jgi:hypothetical protein
MVKLFILSKTCTIALCFIACLTCRAQTTFVSGLKGRWHGTRFDVNIYYDFTTDSTYRYWTSNGNAQDSTRIYHIKDLDPNYFHVMDENHFFILATFYATEMIVFSRRGGKINEISN